MTHCTHCFRYARGTPTSCPVCGRTYAVRLCQRGHVNPRNASVCRVCGTWQLSIPARPGGWLDTVATWTLWTLIASAVGIAAFTLTIGLFVPLDWTRIGWRFVILIGMIGIVYRTSLLLPGPFTTVTPPHEDQPRPDRPFDAAG